MVGAVKVWLSKKDMAKIEFIVATASYLLAEEAAKGALVESGLDPTD